MVRILLVALLILSAAGIQIPFSTAQTPAVSQREAAQSAGLCVATRRFLETAGIGEPLQEVMSQLRGADADAKLIVVTLASFGLCQYTFYSASLNKVFTLADAQGGFQELGRGAPNTAWQGSELPPAFLDLPAAIAAAKREGMSLPLRSAILRDVIPNGKSPFAAWILTPASTSGAHAWTHYVIAYDPGYAPQVEDLRNLTKEHDVQHARIVDPFRTGKIGNECVVLRFDPTTPQTEVLSHQSCKPGS